MLRFLSLASIAGALLGAACYLLMDGLERWITPWQKPAKR